jgi:hypothetical protein
VGIEYDPVKVLKAEVFIPRTVAKLETQGLWKKGLHVPTTVEAPVSRVRTGLV